MSVKRNPNYSIRCSVESCANHCGGEAYCSLESVSIGTHEADPTVQECTDCQSFVRK
ncbi:MAG: DUF1540 domain-containing protein [Clostridia bacterium]|nr:DUF1540 domain-containing protein [Clostridia bacterium]